MDNIYVIFGDARDISLHARNNSTVQSVVHSRIQRYNTAFSDYMTSNGFTTKPLPSLEQLQALITEAQDSDWGIVIGTETKEQYIQNIQNKIDAANYVSEGTPEWDYKQQYTAVIQQFVWPDATELQTREQEKIQLATLLEG